MKAKATRRRGRPKGNRGTCSACGEPGHCADKSGLCSRTYLAARMAIDAGCSTAEAARQLGITRQGVGYAMRSLRLQAAPADSA